MNVFSYPNLGGQSITRVIRIGDETFHKGRGLCPRTGSSQTKETHFFFLSFFFPSL